jgi:hypothetical protein
LNARRRSGIRQWQKMSLSSPGAVAAFVARQIEAHEPGEPLTNLVDLRRCY